MLPPDLPPPEFFVVDGRKLSLTGPFDLRMGLAHIIRERRLRRCYSVEEMATRTGMSLSSYKRFERTGDINLPNLLWVFVVVDLSTEFENWIRGFEDPPPRGFASWEAYTSATDEQIHEACDAKHERILQEQEAAASKAFHEHVRAYVAEHTAKK